jgi:small conductance mechanosensitive channel
MEKFFDHALVQVITTVVFAFILQLVLRHSIARVIRRTVRGHKFANQIDEEKRAKTLITIFKTAISVIIWIVTIVVILWQLDVNIAALMTGAGVVGIVVGFGAQSAIRDFLAGIFVLAENQYRVGDIVTLRPAGVEISGVVEDITVRITRLRDLDGNIHIVQNGSANAVTNMSFGFANVNVDVLVDYDSDVNKVEKVMNEVGCSMSDDHEWAGAIVEPIQFLRVDGFEDSGVRIKALGKVEPAMQWDVAGEFRRRLKVAFEKHGIKIPLPQVVVHQAKRS